MAPSAIKTETIEHIPVRGKVDSDGGIKPFQLELEEQEKVQLVLRTFRCLIADLCQQFNMGHPGSAMGMAAIGVALWKYCMKYSPTNPDFFNRDRFVLSNGHTCLFQYAFLHLVGYSDMTFEQLKSYHSIDPKSICPGHPEIEHQGIEVTTGPLGQGVANAVGFAMATKHLGATFNRPGFDVVKNTTWCMIGDACLQEGVALESIQLAGHWKLNNLVMIYDNNQVTCDGTVDLCNTEDVNAKMIACGWDVITVQDGCFDVEGIVKALVQARASTEKPTFVNIRTVIGFGSQKQGQAITHGAPLGKDDVIHVKKTFGMKEDEHFIVSDEVYDFFREAKPRGQKLEEDWNNMIKEYAEKHSDIYEEFKLRTEGKMPTDWKNLIPSKEQLTKEPIASRKSGGAVCNPLAAALKNFMVGTADLSPSVAMIWKDKLDFQHPDLKTDCGINGAYEGRYIHWGVREHAMASISNGLAAYNKGTILPITSSFFMFYLYAAPGVRMGALQKLQTIHIATHDSIGAGEDGPTHQPIELASLYRSMPTLVYIRPCDGEEVAGAFISALENTNAPTMISLSRHTLKQYPEHSSRDGVLKGAYVFVEDEEADVTLIGVGAEMFGAMDARKVLKDKFDVKARVVSFPSQRLFDQQDIEYKRKVLRYKSSAPRVVIEAYAVNGWERYADAGFNMSTFGHSLPGNVIYDHFGFNAETIATEVSTLVSDVKKNGIESLRGEFRDLNPVKH